MNKDTLVSFIKELLDKNGIDVIYAVTLFCIVIAISYWKDYRDWNDIEYWKKGLAGSALFASIIFSIVSLLRLFGIIDL